MKIFLNYHSELNDLHKTKLNPLISTIYGKEMNLFKEKLNWKRGRGKGFLAHQDQPAWNDFPPQRYVSVVLFANNTTIENGCLEFGWDKNGRIKKLLNNNKEGLGELDKQIVNTLNWYPVETTPRDILIFDSYIPHRSNDNKTDEDRRIFYFTFNEKTDGDFYDKYIEKKRQEFPPEIERDNNTKYNLLGNKYNLANPTE